MRSPLSLSIASLALAGCAGLDTPPPPPGPPPLPPLDEGTPAPDVAAANTADKLVHLSDFHGKPLVLFFYPVDFGSSGTAEAEEFTAALPRFHKLGVAVVGVSGDDVSRHRDFIDHYKIAFPLLSDQSGALARAFRVPLEGGVTRHYTFLIDRHGVIRKVWRNVRAWGHASEVLAYLRTAK